MTTERDTKNVGDKVRSIVGNDDNRNESDPGPMTPGGRDQESVEDRPSVSTVTPEDYPEAERGGKL